MVLASRIPVRTGAVGFSSAGEAGASEPSRLALSLPRSESDASVDSVRLAQALGADKLINDELPPFELDHTSRSASNGDSERPRPEERQDVTTSPNTIPQRPNGLPDTGTRKRGTHTVPLQNTNHRNPPQPSRNRPIGIAASSRQRKTNTTVSATAAGRTTRSASAHELSRFATGTTLSSSPSGRTAGGGGGRTKKPLSTTTSTDANDLPTSSSTHSLSPQLHHHHYPAEAYLIPQITEYRPPEGTDWDHTVIPTIARRMGGSGGGGRGRVGLGFFHDPISPGKIPAGAELVSEWTKDGTPAAAKNVQVGMKGTLMSFDDARTEVEKQQSEAAELDGLEFVHGAHDGNDRDISHHAAQVVGLVEPGSHPSSSSASAEGVFEKTHARGESVLSDLLAEYIQETTVPPSAAENGDDAGDDDDGGSPDEGRLSAGEGSRGDLIDEDVTGGKGNRSRHSPFTADVPSLPTNPQPISFRSVQRTSTGGHDNDALPLRHSNQPRSTADEQSSTEEPAQQQQPFSVPQKQSTTTTTVVQTTGSAARLPIRGLPQSQTRDVPVAEQDMSHVKVTEDSSVGRKAPVATPPPPPPPRKGVEEGHGAGCRCIIM